MVITHHMLKADLHIHTKGDPFDTFLQYTPQDLIKLAAKQKFDILSITWHNKVCDSKSLQAYAKQRGIMLFPGIELTIDKKHTLLYNITPEEAAKVKTFDDLYALKDHVAVGAAHPFFLLPSCLGKTVFEHPKLFDFMEHSHFYTKTIDLNRKAVRAAETLRIPMIANSDIHSLSWFGKDYTLLDAKPTVDGVLDALKKKATGQNKKLAEPMTTPHGFSEFLKTTVTFSPNALYYFLFQHGKQKEIMLDTNNA